MQLLKRIATAILLLLSVQLNAQKTDVSNFFYNGTIRETLKTLPDAAFISFKKGVTVGEYTKLIAQEKGVLRTEAYAAVNGLFVTLSKDLTVETLRQHLKSQKAIVNVTPAFDWAGSRHLVGTSLVFKAKTAESGVRLLKQFRAQIQDVEKVALSSNKLIFINVNPWEDPLSISQQMVESGLVTYAMPDFVKTLTRDYVPNDSLFTQQWYLKQSSGADIAIDSAWEITRGSAAVVVAVIDGDGVDLAHPELQGKIFAAYDAVSDDSIPELENQYNRHNTPCVGLIAAATNNASGVAGVGFNTKVLPIKIGFGATEFGFNTSLRTLSNAAERILREPKIVAVSMSYGGPATLAEQDVYFSMTTGRGDKGVALFAAAGNSTSTAFRYPALFPFVTAIGASNSIDELAYFSNYGEKLAIVAPGLDILTIDNQGSAGYTSGDYTNFGGTSAACPITVGVAALVASVDSNLTAQQIINTICTTADKVGSNANYADAYGHPLSTWSFRMGYGRLNAYKALLKANDRRTLKPNLYARSVAFRLDSSVVTYRVVVANNGTAATTTATTLSYLLSLDRTIVASDTFIGTSAIPILGIGDSVVLNFTRDICRPYGLFRDYYAGLLIDPNNAVAEISESDNEWVNPESVYFFCGANAPNLTRVSDSLYRIGDSIVAFRVRVVNNGNLIASAFKVGFYLSTDSIIRPSDFLVADTTISNLGIGGAINLATSAFACDFLPQTGRYYLGYIIDVTNAVFEKNENDNRFASATASNFTCLNTGCSGTTTLTNCTGNISDGSGGALYSNNLSCSWLIRPTSAVGIALNFTSFDTEDFEDVVRIYDGINSSAPLVAAYTGSGYGVPPSVTSNSGSMFVTFTTSQSGRFDGWSANYTCSPNRVHAINAYVYDDSSGAVTGSGIYNQGQAVTLVAKSKVGWRFINWQNFNGNILHSLDTFKFTATQSLSLVAIFEQIPTCSGTTTLTNCGGVVEDGSGSGSYSANLNCNWLIRPSTNPRSIILKFTDFNLEQGSDFVSFYDGTSQNNPFLGSFTGASLPQDSIIANSGSVFVVFTTSSFGTGQGWRLTYRCDSVRRYTVNASITPTNGGTIVGTGAYTEGSFVRLIARPNAGYIFINWTDTRTGQIVSTFDTLQFTINANRYLSAAFRLKPTCNGLTTLTTCAGSFDDGSGTNPYSDDLNCSWLIQPSTGRSVILRFTEFQTSYSDYVYIYDGTSTNAPLLGAFSGASLPSDSLIANSGTAFVVFRAYYGGLNKGWRLNYRCDSVNQYVVSARVNPTIGGSVTGAGVYAGGAYVKLVARPASAYAFVNWTDERTGGTFSSLDTLSFTVNQNRYLIANFRLKPTCSGQTLITDCSGTFDDGSGPNPYTSELNCSWLIQPTSNPRSIVLNFTSFQLNYSDYVNIYNGTSENAPLLASFSGSNPPSDSVSRLIIANSGRAFVRFTTSYSNNGYQGWQLNYRCDSVRRYVVNAVASPSSSYGTVVGAGAYTEGSAVVLIARPASAAFQLFNWTNQRTGQIVSTLDTLRFSATEHRYLVANFRLTPSCDGLTRLTTCGGSLEDGSGTNIYTANLNCSWLIQPTSAPRSIVFNFNRFETESCCDYVSIYDGTSSSAPLIGSFSGYSVPSNDVVANSGAMFIRFTTDGSSAGQGWSGAYRCDSVRRYVISAQSYSLSYGTVTGSGTYTEESAVTLIASALGGYAFVNWTDARTGQTFSTVDTLRFSATQALSLVANFITRPSCSGLTRLTTPSGSFEDGSGSNNYSNSLNCSWLIQPTASVRRLAMKFMSFSLESCCDYVTVYDGTSASGRLLGTFNGGTTPFDSLIGTSGALFITFTTDGSGTYSGWTANYTSVANAVAVTLLASNSQGGTVTGGGNFTLGQVATAKATPNVGWRFVRWLDNGVTVSTQTEYSFTVTTARLLTAEFQRATYTVTSTANPTNGGTVDGDGTYLAGLNAYLTATAATGFRFVNWRDNNVIVATTPIYTFAIDSNRTLVAHFTATNGTQTLGDNNKVDVFPNPTSGHFTIRLQRNLGPLSINVKNVLGQSILTTTMPAGTTEQSLDLTETGLYWLTLENLQGQKATIKVVVW